MSEVPTPGGSPAPRTPAEWLEVGREIYGEVLEALIRYGVEPDPELQVVPGDLPNPYYDGATKTIALGMPDPETMQGRMYWIYAARIRGVDSVDGAVAAMVEELPLWIAHEVAHHLRERYEAATKNDFVEEQVVNTVALAFLREHSVYRKTLPTLRTHFEQASERLRRLSPGTAPYLPGFRPDMGEVLVAGGDLGRERLGGLRLMAEFLGEPLEELLDDVGIVPDVELDEAETRQREVEIYFNRAYMKNIFEYTLFHMEWLRAYLERDEFPTLGKALETHILTEDWEQTRRQDTILLLTATMHHSSDELAAAAAEALVGEVGEGAVEELLRALGQERPALQAAILRALGQFAAADPRVADAAQRLAKAEEAEVRAAAAEILVRVGGDRAVASRSVLLALLAVGVPAREAALAAISGLEDPGFAAVLTACLTSPAAGERALALRGLACSSPHRAVAELAAAMLSDPYDDVRRAAAACLRARATRAVLPALVRALDDPATTVREEAAAALRAQGAGAIQPLRAAGGSWRVRVEARLLLYALGDPEGARRIRDLVAELAEAADHVADQSATLSAETNAEMLLQEALGEERRKLALLALRLAGALENPAGMDVALRGLASDRAEVRAAALEVARATVPPDLLPTLELLLEASGTREGRASGSGLEDLLDYPEPFLRKLIAEFLILSNVSPETEEVPMLTTIEKLMFLRSISIFRTVPLEDLQPLTEEFVARRYGPGEKIFDIGEEGDALYVVTAGRVAVEQNLPDDSFERIAELGVGDHFGEASFFTSAPRSARATALEDTTLLCLGQETFLRLGAREPRILVEVLRVLSGRLMAANVDLG